MIRRVFYVVVALMLSMAPAVAGMGKTVVEVAADDKRFETLVTAVKAADLAETLNGDGPFTVFAPTNAAFEALPDGTLEALLKPENKDKLAAILTYHVLPGKVMSGDVAGKTVEAETVSGKTLTVDASEMGVKVNGADVVAADVSASNGVIHVVDEVILPPES